MKLFLGFGLILLSLVSVTMADTPYDLVIDNGLVVDPEHHFIGIRNVALRAGKISAITTEPLQGKTHINATGLILSPGFIDLHSHAMSATGQYYQLLDGVTTALELEVGAFPNHQLSTLFGNHTQINYGASAGYLWIREQVIEGRSRVALSSTPSPYVGAPLASPGSVFTDTLSAIQRQELFALLEQELVHGALGIGLPLDYVTNAIDNDELAQLFRLAAKYQRPIFAHIRRGYPGDSSGLDELLTLAGNYRTSLHICHINASAMSGTAVFLAKIDAAHKRGLDVTTEMYPYDAGSTSIGASVFGRDWQKIFAIGYADIEWQKTGERLTKERFNTFRLEDPNGQVVHHYGRKEWSMVALLHPDVIIASDAMPVTKSSTSVHPRGIGTFSRYISTYINSVKSRPIDWPHVLGKTTLLPAQRLESSAKAFTRKGRLQVGMDADITLFDPSTIHDNATYTAPFSPSSGIVHVIVGGQLALTKGKVVTINTGQYLRSE